MPICDINSIVYIAINEFFLKLFSVKVDHSSALQMLKDFIYYKRTTCNRYSFLSWGKFCAQSKA